MRGINERDGLTWLAENVPLLPRGLGIALAEVFSVSRTTASKFIKRQIERGYLESSGSTTRPLYKLGKNRLIRKMYPLPGADESQIWENDFSPYLEPLSDNIRDICHHGFSEMVNNANDHSGGRFVYINCHIEGGRIYIFIGDDGIGIFKKISDALGLPDKKLALLELAKGKFTTDADNHSGEGIFFTSRMFDSFLIEANGIRFDHFHKDDYDLIDDVSYESSGTNVFMGIDLSSNRTSQEIFRDYSSDFAFDRTIIPVRLAKIGPDNLVSRSQAKRLLANVNKFKNVALDFNGVDFIGQAFADEIFRVFQRSHPDVLLAPLNANEEIKKMIERAKNSNI